MSRQVAVRLPDELVEFIDGRVECGEAGSRAAVIAAAANRERRRQVAERDAAILARTDSDDDFDELASFAAGTPLGRHIGYLLPVQEAELAKAIRSAFELV